MNDEPRVGYADFIKLCRVAGDPKTGYGDWAPGLEIREDGVYLVVPHDVWLAPDELAALAQHPTGNLADPALRFPCSLAQLQDLLEDQGVYGCIDPFDMAEWLLSMSATNPESGIVSTAGELEEINSPRAVEIKESVVEPRIRLILRTIEAANWDPLDIPLGGKAAIKEELLEYPGCEMNEETFRTAWREASKRGLVRIHQREKFFPR